MTQPSTRPLNFIQQLLQEAPSLGQLVASVREQALMEAGALSVKNKLLIAMALDIEAGHANGARSLAAQARKEGATEQEIVEVLQVCFAMGGMQQMSIGAGVLDTTLR